MEISVVIPIYNVQKYLRKCLDSVCIQDRCVEEIILVNDGSSDGSLEICREYADKDDRIKIVDQENGGVENAVIAGVSFAHGKYVGFVDGDDFIEPSMFRKLYDRLSETQADIVMCNYDRLDENHNFISEYKFGFPSNEFCDKKQGVFDCLILPRIGGGEFLSYARWNKLFTRQCLLDNKFFKANGLRVGEDTVMVYSTIFSCNRIAHVNECLYHYVQRPCSIVHSFDASYLNNWETVVGILYDAAKEYDYRLKDFDDMTAALLYHLCIGKIRLSKLSRKSRAAAYKTIGDNKTVHSLLHKIKLNTSFKHKIVYTLLKHKCYRLLSLIY